ncbi:DUF4236 domain-containing protein [Salinicola halophilus]|uniref:DUF4236 domain-containing protein n=1 Tax=Salinicola halophilus TaxID=184065 RepID=UPI000DA1D8D6
MGLHFRRTWRLAPGLRLRMGKGGPALSIGPRGANLVMSRRGIHSHAGPPGTGIYHRQALWKRKQTGKKR